MLARFRTASLSRSFLIAALLLGFGAATHAEERLRFGVIGGFERWEEDASTPVPGVAPATLDGGADAAVGLVAQYMARHQEDGGFFIGIEASGAPENVSHTETVAFGGTNFEVTGNIDWNADLLWFGGYDFGRISPFLAVGASVVGGSGSVDFGGSTFEDEQIHIGWKLGPGVDVDLGNNMSLVIRATVGRYRNRTYAAAGLPVDVEPSVADVRIAWLYRFSAEDVLGIFSRR